MKAAGLVAISCSFYVIWAAPSPVPGGAAVFAAVLAIAGVLALSLAGVLHRPTPQTSRQEPDEERKTP